MVLRRTGRVEDPRTRTLAFAALRAARAAGGLQRETTPEKCHVASAPSAIMRPDEMILIRAGSFPVAGSQFFGGQTLSTDRVTISRDFLIGKYPVTVGEFREFIEATGYLDKIASGAGVGCLEELFLFTDPIDKQPIRYVDCFDREAYVAWKGEGYFIPTAAEWEFVARGSEGRLYPSGDKWKRPPNFGAREIFPVDSFPEGATPEGVSGFGIVWEATSSWHEPIGGYGGWPGEGLYDPKITTDPKGPEKGNYVEVRGGSVGVDWEGHFCGAFRGKYFPPDRRSGDLGFRVAKRINRNAPFLSVGRP